MATVFRKGLRSLGSRTLINKIITRQFSNNHPWPLISIINNQSPSLFSNLYKNPSTESRIFIDIGAKARKLQQQRLWTYALALGGVVGFVYLVLVNFEDQLVFYVTPTEAFEKYKANHSKNKFRLGRLVLEGSVTTPSSFTTMYEGSLPDLFREGHSAIVEGTIFPLTDEIPTKMDFYFNGSEVLAKHDEKYILQEFAAALERNKAKLKEEAEAQTEEEAVKSEKPTKSDMEIQRES
ncbi:hypothetical protein MKX01_037829 [Papaver californicum]|nr:hypothetical protein MKX01_037829 [Papaver californicum]